MIINPTMQNEDLPQNKDLLLASYDFNLPPELIADRPIAGRHNSKLLVYRVKENIIEHRKFFELPEILPENHLLVLNQSKVFPCRLIGQKPSGGKCEVFVLSLIDEDGVYPALVKTRGKKSDGDTFIFGELIVTIVSRSTLDDGSFLIRFNQDKTELLNTLEQIGKIPIPPYIRDGQADEQDLEDYQTVYAKQTGSVAAPTAGLHFTEKVFSELSEKGIDQAFVTLHVGAGTFKPVITDTILDHSMHSECYDIDDENLQKIQTKQNKIIAVGTTSLRVLESCSDDNGKVTIERKEGEFNETSIFLYPGKEVHSIAGLLTNFHLPKSSLLMLVSSIIGREKALELYATAIENEYRFFSYGDAMLIIR